MGQGENYGEKQHLPLLLCVNSLDVMGASVCLRVIRSSSQRWFRPQKHDVGDKEEDEGKKGEKALKFSFLGKCLRG